MAYKITDSCISCGTCKDACPVDAISEGADKYEIAEDACIYCGSCASECPADAIEADLAFVNKRQKSCSVPASHWKRTAFSFR